MTSNVIPRRLTAPPRKRPDATSILVGLFALGIAVAVLRVGVWPHIDVATRWVQHTCIVVDERLVEEKGEDASYRAELEVAYQVGGAWYRSWASSATRASSSSRGDNQAELDAHHVGASYPCWYDPADPAQVVVFRGLGSSSLGGGLFALLVLSVFVGMGAHSAYWRWRYRGLSDEQIAHLASATQPASEVLPTVPAPQHTPGKRGAYRLTAAHDLGGGFVVLVLFSLFWTIPSSAVIRNALENAIQWWTAVVLLPHAAMLVFICRRVLVFIGVRPTDVEVSRHPVEVGERFTLHFTQHGPLRTNSIDVRLVCEEEVQYRVGTDTRTETRVVYEQQLVSELGLHITLQRPLQAAFELTIPERAMHSFEMPCNTVRWRVVTRGDVPRFPDFERSAPLVVVPARPVAGGYRAPGRA
jgi:hypothetical protein